MGSEQDRSRGRSGFWGMSMGALSMVLLLIALPALSQTTNLVSGKYSTEWTRIAIPPTGQVGKIEQWHVYPGKREIVCDGNGGHDWFRYNKEFANFSFHVEWRFTPVKGERKYNSGVFFRNNADGSIWHQAQTTPEGGYLFGATPVNGKLTSFNEQKNMKENRVKPAGEWNAFDIRCMGETCTLAVNGEVVNTIKVGVRKGYVGLESEGYQIRFRNMKVEELP